MLVTQHPVFRRFWYPVMPLSLLEQGSPQPFELLGEKIVLWLDQAGQPQAAADRCCHRSAQLSKGIVCDGHIRCPYHGWEFDGTGACVKVPQLPARARIPEGYRIPAYLCQARYGYAWVCLDPQPLRDIPVIPEAEDPSYRLIHEFYERWECASLRICENEFDAAHFSFVHQNTFGSLDNLVPSHFEIEELDYGIRTRLVVGVANPELQQKNLGIPLAKTERTTTSTWYLPFTNHLHIRYPNGRSHVIVNIPTPINDRASQVVQFCLRNDTEADAPASEVVRFDRAVTLEDRAILETTDPDVPLDLSAEQHMFTDKPGILMRKQLAALLKAHGNASDQLF
ncbi:Rieske 2Fe-2S domain-containing protein [Synechococcus sp. OH20]|uniref:aromatic ring-hydroxylating dioxygenase subunit alpha n=1 Tax=unclassified Synechococcus TaxID=2626047 RepID=UPI0039C6A5D8